MCQLKTRITRCLNDVKWKFKSNCCIKFLMKLIRKFQLNIKIKYFCYIIISSILIYIFLIPIDSIPIGMDPFNNETVFVTVFGWKFKDHSALVTAIVGMFAFFITKYNVDMNFKSAKLSSIPNNSADLLIDLELLLNEYDNDNNFDVIETFIEILKYWKNHQKALRLLAPKFYKKFLKFYSMPLQLECEDLPQINGEYIIKAMRTQIIDVAFDGNKQEFYFIKPSLIKMEMDIRNLGVSKDNYRSFELNKKGLKYYIDKIDCENTKFATNKKFLMLLSDLEVLLDYLKTEIVNYDLL